MPKLCPKFFCEKCDYSTSKKSSFNNHLLSAKHKKSMIEIMPQSNYAKFTCQNCNKTYKDSSGLWRHKKQCKIDILEKEECKKDEYKKDEYKKESKKCSEISDDLILSILKQNTEFQQMIVEQNKTIIELSKNACNNSHNTNSNNKSFNLQFFLNETCKDAMNIMDFVSQLQIGIDDLEETARLGFAGGISKIFINGLKDIDVPHRPVHCTDPKRETLYIKNGGQWNKEDEDKILLINAIKHVANKNMKQIPEWKKQHPGHNNSESKDNDKYLKIICESISGSTQEETNKNYNKIIRNIVKETIIDK